ncbi:MAG: hypothetical protein ABFS38_21200 [Bacteroidota bacterium]
MKGFFRHRQKDLSILLIIVMAALMFNKVLYTHIHVLPNGSVVTHAHPFSKSTEGNPASSHQHSNTELFLLNQLNILMFFISAAFVLKQFAASSCFNEPATERLFTAFVPHSPGRAPPTCM